jgi:rubrerythrin
MPHTVGEILDFAIEREEEANRFYLELSAEMERPEMKKVFQDFAQEELGHKRKLVAIKEGKILLSAGKKVEDLRLADYLITVEPGTELDYQQALVLAMKKEKASYKLYFDMASSVESETLRQTLLGLAQEEAKHKLRLEIEYDQQILKEN